MADDVTYGKIAKTRDGRTVLMHAPKNVPVHALEKYFGYLPVRQGANPGHPGARPVPVLRDGYIELVYENHTEPRNAKEKQGT